MSTRPQVPPGTRDARTGAYIRKPVGPVVPAVTAPEHLHPRTERSLLCPSTASSGSDLEACQELIDDMSYGELFDLLREAVARRPWAFPAYTSTGRFPVPPVEALPPVPRAARRGGGTGDPRPGAGCGEEPASGQYLPVTHVLSPAAAGDPGVPDPTPGSSVPWRTRADRVGGWLLYAALFASTAYLVCLGAPVVGRLIAARLS